MIEHYRFGQMTVNGTDHQHDLKIIGDRIVPEWRRQEGHRLQMSDISDIVAEKPDILVIGTGYSGHMQVPDALLKKLRSQHIKVRMAHTAQAVQTFNALYQNGAKVAGAFHLTC